MSTIYGKVGAAYGKTKYIQVALTSESIDELNRVAKESNVSRNILVESILRSAIELKSNKYLFADSKQPSSVPHYGTAKKRTSLILSSDLLNQLAEKLENTQCSRSELIERIVRYDLVEKNLDELQDLIGV